MIAYELMKSKISTSNKDAIFKSKTGISLILTISNLKIFNSSVPTL